MVVELLHRPHLQHLPPSKIFPPPPPKNPKLAFFFFWQNHVIWGPKSTQKERSHVLT